MSEVILGRTGIRSPKNAFGVLPIQRVDKEYAAMLLRKAHGAGFTFFDTARAYSDSEEKIGYALSDVRDSITLATKTGAKDAATFWQHLETSLKNLRTDHIDIYQFHNPATVPMPGDGSGLYEAMAEAKAQGKIRHIGITNHTLATAEAAVRSGLYDTLQFPLCYLAQEADLNLVRLCEEHDVGFIAMKALSGGLLTRSDAAFAWMSGLPSVLPIWGIQRESELDEFISYMTAPPVLNDEMRALIDHDRAELAGSFCRACGYCMPTCPMGIEISSCARMSQLIRRSPSSGHLSERGQAMMKKVESCIDCGVCKTKCPYGLDTPALLRQHYEDYKRILAGEIVV